MSGESRKNHIYMMRLRVAALLAVILPVMLIAASAVIVSGCGDDNDQDTSSTGTTAKTSTKTATTSTGMDSTVEVPPSPEPAPAPAPAPSPAPAVPLKIVFYAVDPNTVHAGAPLTCMVSVEGTATAVTMGLTGPSGSVPQTVNLAEGTTVGGVTNWTATVAAPVTPGGWRFGATAVAIDGTVVIPDAGGLSASLLPFEVIP